MPFKAAAVGLSRLGKMLFEQARCSGYIATVPGLLGHVDVVGVHGSLELLLFGGELVGEGFDFVALLLGFVALLSCFSGFFFGFLGAGLGLIGVRSGLGLCGRGAD